MKSVFKSAFGRHDQHRSRLIVAISELDVASVFGPAPASVSDLGLRLFYLKGDTITMIRLLLELDDAVRPWADMLANSEVSPAERMKRFRQNSEDAFKATDRLAVVYKSVFFLSTSTSRPGVFDATRVRRPEIRKRHKHEGLFRRFRQRETI